MRIHNTAILVRPGNPPLQQAINDAPEGTTLILDKGLHPGPITLSKRLTIVGGADAEIGSPGPACIIATGEGVNSILKNLRFRDTI